MKFLQDLNESRMYRRLGQLDGKSIHDIAERLFEHLLALQILANTDKSYATRYTRDMMKQPAFDGFRSSQSDLYNLIALVLNQETYSYLIDNDTSVGLPEMRLRRNLIYMSNGKFDNNDYSQLMLMIQRRFDKLPKMLIALRRQISNWDSLNTSDQKTIVRRLLTQMREKGMQSDLYQRLSR